MCIKNLGSYQAIKNDNEHFYFKNGVVRIVGIYIVFNNSS